MVKLSLIDPAGKDSAIDHEQMSGNEAGGVRCQEHGCTNQFLKISKAPHGRAHQELFAPRRPVQEMGVEISPEKAGRQRIHAYPVFGPLDGQRLGQ